MATYSPRVTNFSSESTTNAVRKYKLVFLGDQSVGKTSIITRFMYDSFDNTYQPTIGIDFLSKTIHLDSKSVPLQLWDTAGQERFRSLIPSYIRDSSIAIVVYDITNRESFTNVTKWIDNIRGERGESVVIMLCGNKTDLEDLRAVTREEGESTASKLKLLFMETSAKAGFNVKSLFVQVVAALPGMDNINLEPCDNVINLEEQTKPTQNTSDSNNCIC